MHTSLQCRLLRPVPRALFISVGLLEVPFYIPDEGIEDTIGGSSANAVDRDRL